MDEYRHGNVDVVVSGEVSEWQYPEYVRDSCSMGMPKGLILLGHCNSEEHAMGQLASWLKARFSTRCPAGIHFIPSADPLMVMDNLAVDNAAAAVVDWSRVD